MVTNVDRLLLCIVTWNREKITNMLLIQSAKQNTKPKPTTTQYKDTYYYIYLNDNNNFINELTFVFLFSFLTNFQSFVNEEHTLGQV